jgi:4-amino-4-deoxy-L-arabinose transferase-like glycosyltransferase
MPGFPYFLAAVDLISGHSTGGRAALHDDLLAQAVLGTAAVALIGLVALEVFGPTVALIALVIAALYPVLIEMSRTLVAENLLVVLEFAAVWAALRARRTDPGRKRYAWIGAAGVLTGLATLTHENAIVLALPLGFAVWTGRPRRSAKALLAPALLLAATLVAIAPWTVRNAIVMHRFLPVSDETGITLVGTYNTGSAAFTPVPYKWRIYYGIPGETSLVRRSGHLTELQLSDRLLNQALHYIGDHPLAPLVVGYHNTLRLFELEGSVAWRASAVAIGLPLGVAQLGVISFWILTALAVAGALTRTARRAPRWLWVVPLLLVLSVVMVNAETPRFREPVDPFVILLASCALGALLQRLRGSPVRRDAEPAVSAGGGELVEVV